MTKSVQENDGDADVSESLEKSKADVMDGESQVSVRQLTLDHPQVEIETSELDSDIASIDENSDGADDAGSKEDGNKEDAKNSTDEGETKDGRPVGDDGDDDGDEVLPRMLGDRYRLESLIAKGGMGEVYRATQLPLGRSVAIKVLGSSSKLDAGYRRRFLLEASVCAGLTHRNIVVVYDYGETPDGVLFMAMELLPGRRLSQVIIEDGPLPVDRGVFVALQIARALREAHRQGVAHRDLKPGNVFLAAGSDDNRDIVKVFDFGLAKVFEDPKRRDQNLTMDGVMMGSPRYMSPEQIRGEEVDARADIYSFGALIYMLVCGRPPFLGQASIDVLAAQIQQEPPTFEEALADQGHTAPMPIPPALQTLALRCLEKEAGNRFQSMDEPILELKRVLASLNGELSSDRTSSGFAPAASHASSASHPAIPLGVMVPPVVDTSGSHRVPVLGAPPTSGVGAGSNRGSRIATAIIIAVLLGAALAVLLPAESDPSTAQMGEVSMAFASEPAGAAVYLDEVRQGVTPFEATYESGSSLTFRFRMAGFEDELVRSEVAEGLEVDVRLRSAAPSAQPVPTAEQNDPLPMQQRTDVVSAETPVQPQEPMGHRAAPVTPMQRDPRTTMRTLTPMAETPTTPMLETAVERPQVVPLIDRPRGLVDDSARVPLVD